MQQIEWLEAVPTIQTNKMKPKKKKRKNDTNETSRKYEWNCLVSIGI